MNASAVKFDKFRRLRFSLAESSCMAQQKKNPVNKKDISWRMQNLLFMPFTTLWSNCVAFSGTRLLTIVRTQSVSPKKNIKSEKNVQHRNR